MEGQAGGGSQAGQRGVRDKYCATSPSTLLPAAARALARTCPHQSLAHRVQLAGLQSVPWGSARGLEITATLRGSTVGTVVRVTRHGVARVEVRKVAAHIGANPFPHICRKRYFKARQRRWTGPKCYRTVQRTNLLGNLGMSPRFDVCFSNTGHNLPASTDKGSSPASSLALSPHKLHHIHSTVLCWRQPLWPPLWRGRGTVVVLPAALDL